MPIYIIEGRYTRDAIKGMITEMPSDVQMAAAVLAVDTSGGETDLRATVVVTSVEAKGAFAAASDLASGFESPGRT